MQPEITGDGADKGGPLWGGLREKREKRERWVDVVRRQDEREIRGDLWVGIERTQWGRERKGREKSDASDREAEARESNDGTIADARVRGEIRWEAARPGGRRRARFGTRGRRGGRRKKGRGTKARPEGGIPPGDGSGDSGRSRGRGARGPGERSCRPGLIVGGSDGPEMGPQDIGEKGREVERGAKGDSPRLQFVQPRVGRRAIIQTAGEGPSHERVRRENGFVPKMLQETDRMLVEKKGKRGSTGLDMEREGRSALREAQKKPDKTPLQTLVVQRD